jgi:Phage derived protein Gp49-like (DUF891)
LSIFVCFSCQFSYVYVSVFCFTAVGLGFESLVIHLHLPSPWRLPARQTEGVLQEKAISCIIQHRCCKTYTETTSERHGPPLTELVDQKYDIFELRIGDKNIARVFFFFRQGREIIMTNGYVKKQQKVDTRELARARTYKKDWEERQL